MNKINTLLAQLDRRLRNQDDNGEATDDELDVTEVLEELLSVGWDPNARDANGSTLLHELAGDDTLYHWAAAGAIEFLLANGGDVNAQDKDGLTPLHLAAATGFGIIHTLLKHGADKTLRTIRPVSIAVYADRGCHVIPAGSTAYDLGIDSGLPEKLVEALRIE